MKRIALFLLVFGTSSVYAGELWEIVSTSAGPDGTPISNTQTKCLPRNSVDATHMMDELGNCKFDRKSGNDAAMTFAMTCKIQGMPAGAEFDESGGRCAAEWRQIRYALHNHDWRQQIFGWRRFQNDRKHERSQSRAVHRAIA